MQSRDLSLTRQSYLPVLDGLRAVAVLCVIGYHAGLPIPGDLGVTGFFALSGFLITRLLIREVDETGSISFRGFYIRRTLRIFPAYYAFIILSLLRDRVAGQVWTTGYTAAAFGYAMNYHNAFWGHHGGLAHMWSLAVEEQFYLLWPLAFLFLFRNGREKSAWGLLAVIVAVAAWRSFLFLHVGVGSEYVYNAFDTRFDSLAVGCLLAVLLTLPGVDEPVERLVPNLWAPAVTLGLLLLSRVGGTLTYHYTLGFTVDSVLITIFMLQVIVLSTAGPWTLLSSGPVRWLGRLSYPLYLWHLLGAGLGRRTGGGPWVEGLAGLAASIVLASASYYLIERPALRLKDRFQQPAKPAPIPVEPHAAEPVARA